jgi:hypothetical protein
MSEENKQYKAFNVRLLCSTARTQIGVKHWRAPRDGIAREPVVACSCRALRQSPGHVRERGVAQVEHEPGYHDRRDASRM